MSNRLAREKSPYLLQHAENPVDWYPWGEEAFAKAKAEDKAVLLSIGYSTCHWCHVMAHESFENPDIARLMNEFFVCIKVDREERPDVDHIYMNATTAMTGQGGWPLTVFLTADQRPFFGGTYFPPQAKWGSPGFVDLLKSIHHAWVNNRDQIAASSHSLTDLLRTHLTRRQASDQSLSPETVDEAYRQLAQGFDRNLGGFGPAPKFPMGHTLSFMLRCWGLRKSPEALHMVEVTLEAIQTGGIYDHLGGGFHRYSTDAVWHVPHFEKMLYDQALLVRAYLEAYQINRKASYARTVRETLEYVIRNMMREEGGFYSAEDADSPDPDDPGHNKEGAFYVWSQSEVERILGEEAPLFIEAFGIEENGNAKSDPHGEFIGKNILYAAKTHDELAHRFSKTPSEIDLALKRCQALLLNERARRPRPHLDDKILTDWNGLMISAFATASLVLDEPAYLEPAKQAADFILERLIRKDGRLLHRYRDGESAIPGSLEDYGFFACGLLDLYEASFEPKYLRKALQLTEDMVRLFWDEAQAGFFMTASDAESLIVRPKDIYDGAIPSGNSMAAQCLIRIGQITWDAKWPELAEGLFKSFGALILQHPSAYPACLTAYLHLQGPAKEIILVGQKNDPDLHNMRNMVYKYFIPYKSVIQLTAGADELIAVNPAFGDYKQLSGKCTAYICQNHSCRAPTTEADQVEAQLRPE